MKEFAGRVAVVTGAASGMGLAFAHRFAGEGMNVVLADIESEPLAMAEAAVKAKGARTLAVRTNVMSAEDIEQLADAAFAAFGNVHILCNNAGVAAPSASARPVWESSLRDWEWVFGVNFMGVLHGIRAFVPRMVANGEEGHIVNTASLAGLLTGANPYNVSKHGVVCLTEGLYRDFKTRDLALSASVLCPGWVNTNIADAERNRPREFGARGEMPAPGTGERERFDAVVQFLKDGIAPDKVAQQVFEAVRDDRFYIIPAQPPFLEAVKARFDAILDQRNPAVVPPRLSGWGQRVVTR